MKCYVNKYAISLLSKIDSPGISNKHFYKKIKGTNIHYHTDKRIKKMMFEF